MDADKKLRPRQLQNFRRIEHGAMRTMKATKKTEVPLPPVSKPKAKASLSQEFIGSDDEDSSTEQTTTSTAKPQPKTTIAVHRPNGAAKPKQKSSTKESTTSKAKSAPAAKIPPKKAAPKVVTQAQVDELSSSEQSDDDAPTRDIQTKLPGNKGRASESGSDSDSDSDSSSDDSSVQQAPTPVNAYVTMLCSLTTKALIAALTKFVTGKHHLRKRNRTLSSSGLHNPTYRPKTSLPYHATTGPSRSRRIYSATWRASNYGTLRLLQAFPSANSRKWPWTT
jgi:hypothetical protein